MANNSNQGIDEYISLRDVAYRTLRKQILEDVRKPGERLMEIQLSKEIGVSRTPVREALHMLELDGLVVMIPKCGARVASISSSDLKDVLEVRRALDELAIKLACKRINSEQLDRLYQAMIKFKEATLKGNIEKIARADELFHDIIVEASFNKKLTYMMQNLSEQVYRFRYECVKDASMYGELMKEHQEMYESIKNKDEQRAAQAVDSHIIRQEQAIIRNLHL